MKSAHPRRKFKAVLAAALIATSASLTVACSPVVEERGYIFDAKDLEQVHAGDSREQVKRLLGTPSTVSTVSGEAWYYISSTFETYAFYAPEEVDRKVAAVYFDKSGIVDDVAYYGLEDGNVINFADRKTPTRGKEMTVLEQLFSNIGRYNNAGANQPQPGN
ncbi:outer membrane protein assembly factor BamE (lipoprotein component of BamABCDE complex) [Parvibaculum indicum]|uniref:outer membrane protein assembly factor BamE n=1 Tax=Parvibaculum indicum TaxID=562969 RepID=UPI00141F7DCC|nr:outer membrane protein assembly factor BamE [Parvibaculum indicum]NIJ39947.1 outer membrane protein assembly factor BamE (lipoprotein component of BamABCDE complex) [Parvibaculum indicum]